MTVQLTLLTAGSCRHPERVVRRGGRWRPADIPSLVAVIRHPQAGVVLFDTGYAPRFFAETAKLPASIYARVTPVRCAEPDTAAAQLRDRGIDPAEVALIVISHFHGDHIAGLRDFPAAKLLYARSALAPAWRGHGGIRNLRDGFLPGLLPADFDARSEFADDLPQVPLPPHTPGLGPGFDLLGDGSVLGIELSGHTPGQLGLLVRQPAGAGQQSTDVLLAADACWSGRALTHGELPHPAVRLITADWAAYRRVIAALRDTGAAGAAGAADRDVLIVPSHCPVSIARAQEYLSAMTG